MRAVKISTRHTLIYSGSLFEVPARGRLRPFRRPGAAHGLDRGTAALRWEDLDVDRSIGRTGHAAHLSSGWHARDGLVRRDLQAGALVTSQTWRTFLANHVEQIMAADFFVVPTVTYRLLFVLDILAHNRRRVVHVAVTEHPTSAWTAQQLRNAFSASARAFLAGSSMLSYWCEVVVDRTNRPSPARDRKFSITSALSIAAHTEGATPNNRMACGLVNLSPGVSRYCSRTRCSSAASGAERGGNVIIAA